MNSTRFGSRTLVLSGLLVVLAVGLFAPAASATVPEHNSTAAANGSLNVTVWTAPAAKFDALDSSGTVHEMRRNGTLTRNRTIAERDVVVLAVESSRVRDALERERTSGQSATRAFVELFSRSGTYGFSTYQRNVEMGIDAPRLNLTQAAAADGLRVVPDDDAGTVFVVLKTDRLVLDTWVNGSTAPGRAFNTTVLVNGTNPGRASVTWRVAERTVQFETGPGDVIRVGTASGCLVIRGRTSVAPGTRLPIRFEASSGQSSTRTTAVVTARRTFSTTFDTPIHSNETFGVSVPTIPESTAQGVVGSHDPWSFGDLLFRDQRVHNGTVTVYSVTMGGGGFVVLYPQSVVDDIASRTVTDGCVRSRVDTQLATGRALGVSEYVPPGTTRNVTVDLDTTLAENQTLVAVPFRDTNDNHVFDLPTSDANPERTVMRVTDGPLAQNGSLVLDSASVAVERRTDTTPDTTTRSRTPTPRPGTDTAPTQSTDTTTQPGESATTTGTGPGLVTLALVTIALLFRRRA